MPAETVLSKKKSRSYWLFKLSMLLGECKSGAKLVKKVIKKIKNGGKVVPNKLERIVNTVRNRIWQASKIRSCHIAVFNPRNEILILQNTRKEWTLPGGQLDKGEPYLLGALREVREETGLKRVTICKSSEIVQTSPYAGNRKVGRIARATVNTVKAVVTLTAEHLKSKWISIKESFSSLIPRHRLAVACFC